MTVVLDSWAILEWLDGRDPASSRVDEVMFQRPTVSWINLVEVYHRLERVHGREQADSVFADLRRTVAADLPGTGRMLAAARIKAERPLALGGAFAIATAEGIGGELWTGDPEIIGQRGLACPVIDLRVEQST